MGYVKAVGVLVFTVLIVTGNPLAFVAVAITVVIAVSF